MTQPRPSRAKSDAQRSAATRTRLLDAAFECLVEVGYARTTTVEICRRAEAPRGTLLHHYRSRDELMLAAVGHVLELRVAEFDRALSKMARRRERAGANTPLPVDEVIDELWKVISGPTTHAWLELLVAARTNPELHSRFKRQMASIDQRVHETYRNWIGGGKGQDALNDIDVRFAFAVLNGLSLDWQYKPRREVTSVLAAFKALSLDSFAAREPA